MSLVETHAHLNLLQDPTAALARARKAGVTRVVTIGVDLASSVASAEFAAAHAEVCCTVGLHPHDASQATPELWRRYRELAREAGAVAVGECGLDYHYDHSPRDVQRRVFAEQLELTRELDLPVVIHSREADPDTLAILADAAPFARGGVVHCYSSGLETAGKLLDLGFCLGFTGVVTFKNAQRLRQVAREIPLERVLLETDCPYMAPVPHRGKPSEPAHVALVAQCIAAERGLDPAEVARATTANAARLFGWEA